MKRSSAAPTATVLLLLVLLMASDMMTGANAEDCLTKSKNYWGVCFSDHCDEVCKQEGFQAGKCTKIWQCDCSKPCATAA